MTRFPSARPLVASDPASCSAPHSGSSAESDSASNPGSQQDLTIPNAQRPTPNTQHPTPNAQRPTPSAQRPTPNTQRPTPNAQRPTPNRLLFPLLSLFPLLAIPLALPAGRIQMGAEELRGLIGSYTGHGNWAITATYSGAENVTSLFTGGSNVGGSIGAVIGDKAYLVSSGSFALSMLNDQLPFENTDGGCSMQLDNALTMNFQSSSLASATLKVKSSGAKVTFGMTWLPENDDPLFDPPPSKVAVFYRRLASATASAAVATPQDVSQASANATADDLSAQAVANAPGTPSSTQVAEDPGPEMVEELLPVSGGNASKTFDIDCNYQVSQQCQPNSYNAAGASGFTRIDFCVGGFDYGRFNHPLQHNSGGQTTTSPDPTFTRWLPLNFSPQLSSQPYRFSPSAALPAPWGNINCFYSMSLVQEPSTPNADISGAALLTQPTFNAQHAFNGIAGPFRYVQGGFVPAYSLMDANGDRLMFDANLNPYGDVHSTLTNLGGGIYQLTKAGPPGYLSNIGDYTYTFQVLDPKSTPRTARLVSFHDDLGNTQTLTWNGTNSLTVSDSSSGRQMLFNPGLNGYFGSVDSPDQTGAPSYTHTALTFDTTGHLTSLTVYAGNSTLALDTQTFGYGGPTGDSVVSAQTGTLYSFFTYTSTNQGSDPFGNNTPRLATVTAGNSGDTSSSDDGGSVAGTYSYTYGPTQYGYNWWGVSAHNNTITDARGNLYTTRMELSSGIYGGIIGMFSSGPAFSGSSWNNMAHITYSPNIDQPQSVNFYDQLFYAGVTTQPWQVANDLLGNPTSFTDPLGHSWQFDYTPDGKITSILDPTFVGLGYTYGERNNPVSRLTTLTTPDAGSVQIDYNGFGQPLTVTRPATSSITGIDEILHFDYQPTSGDLMGITGSRGDQIRFTSYDALGDPLGIVCYPDTGDPNTSVMPIISRIYWNADQCVSGVILPNGVQASNNWTDGILTGIQCNAPVASGGGVLSRIGYTFDTRGRLASASDLLGICAQYKYDKNSNVTRIVDGNSHGTSLVYGNVDEPTALIWPDGKTATVLYDAAGRVRQTTDELGYLTDYQYDNAHHLTDVQWRDAPSENVHYTYDAAGRMLSVQDRNSTRNYTYDLCGRLAAFATTYNGLPPGHNTFTFIYQYNNDGSIASVTTPVGLTRYTYDASSKLTRIDHPYGISSTFNYDHIGRLLGRSTTVGQQTLSTSVAYGGSGLPNDPSNVPVYLRQITHSWSGQPLWTYILTHSFLGQLLRQDTPISNGQVNSSNTESWEQFNYDLRGRISGESQHWQPAIQSIYNWNSNYISDGANNIQQSGSRWTTNASNQLVFAPASSASTGLLGATNLVYDAAGNTTSYNNFTLNFDRWHHLTNFGTNISYGYDSAGRRLFKTVNGRTTWFLYCGNTLLGELDGNGNFLKVYINEGNGPLMDITASQARIYIYDGLGSTRALLDANTGATLWQGAWTAWGAPLVDAPSMVPTPFGYRGQFGQYADGETGLLYLTSRYYSPALGRFLSRDPIAFAGGTNVYAYCGGDPINSADPGGLSGLQFQPPQISGGYTASVTPATTEVAGAVGQTSTAIETQTALETGATVSMESSTLVSSLTTASTAAVAGVAANAVTGVYYGHQLGVEIAEYQETCEELEQEMTNPVELAANPRLGSTMSQRLNRCRSKCFVRGTPVQVARRDIHGNWKYSTRPIEQVKEGDYVAARNEHTGQVSPKRVLATSTTEANLVISISLRDSKTGKREETLVATREHPFYVIGKGFQPAGALKIGDRIVTRDGAPLIIEHEQWLRKPDGFIVYNICVDDDHTYFVGTNHGGTWVHNPSPGMRGTSRTQEKEKELIQWLAEEGWEILGGGSKPQICYNDPDLPPSGKRGRQKGALVPDIVIRHMGTGEIMFVQTVDVDGEGAAIVSELEKARKLSGLKGGKEGLDGDIPVLLWPKWK